MGFFGGLLERIGLRKPAAPARRIGAIARRAAAPPPTKPAEPLETARPVPPAPPEMAAKPPAAAPRAHAPAKDEAQLRREQELKDVRRSFQHGILDARFKDLDVDHRFLEDFRKFLEAGVKDVLVPPAAAFDVMRIVDDPGYPVPKVAAAIACDPALAGSVVSLANSPLHRGSAPVDSVSDAIVRLGQKRLRLLMLEIALGSTRVQAKPYEGFSNLCWKHSLLVAQLAGSLAPSCGQDPDHAYMAGLFHDVGKFAVLTAARKLANRQNRGVTPQTLLKLLDDHACALGERVVGGWRLPAPVAAAVVHHRTPHEAGPASLLAALTELANDLGRPLGAWVPAHPIDFSRHAAVEALKLDPARLPDEKAILELALKIEKVAGLH
jgi:HD-like signal output (HDOD) protein